jgi:hypothetical protein
MRVTTTRVITLAAALRRCIVDRWIGRLLTGHVKFLPSHDLSSTEPEEDTPKDRTLSRHVVMGVIPHKIPLPFTWHDAANRGLALLAKQPNAILEKDQQDRLRHVFIKLLQEGTKDAYMVWEDFKNVDGSTPMPNHSQWLQAIVRHLRHALRVQNLFGPEIPDDNLLMAFGRWDDNITRTLRNINLVVTASLPVVGVAQVLPPVWRTVFSYFAGLIAADRQILSCYRSYWEALPWRGCSASLLTRRQLSQQLIEARIFAKRIKTGFEL